MPVEPPPTRWAMPDPRVAADDLVALGADLEPGTLLAAYRCGLFPMPLGDAEPLPGGPAATAALGWFSPDPRGVIERLHVSRSLARSLRRYEIRWDTAFEAVVDGCTRPPGWITPEMRAAYVQLHALGWAHSAEAWDEHGLAGGCYGVRIGGLFAAESMFHVRTDAGKAAVHAAWSSAELFDVQWWTEHLATLGAVEIPREEYLQRLRAATRKK